METTEPAHRRQGRRAVAALFAGSLWLAPLPAATDAADAPALAAAQKPPHAPAAPAILSPQDTAAGNDAATVPARVEVRTGQHRGFSRVIFDWPDRVDYAITPPTAATTEGADDSLVVTFARLARIDGGPLRHRYLKYIRGGNVETTADQTRVVLQIAPGAIVRDSVEGAKVVIDVLAPLPPRKGALISQAAPPLLPPKPSTDQVGSSSAAPPAPLPAPAPAAAPVPDADPPPALASPAAPARQPEAEPPAPRAPASPPSQPSAPPQPFRAPQALPPQPASPQPPLPAPEAALRFAWDHPVAAAVFRRGDALWCVFDQPSRQNLAALRVQGGGRITEVEQRSHARATILRLATVANIEPQVERDGLAWIVRLGASRPAAGEPIVPEIDTSSALGARLLLPVAEPGAPIAVSDPEVGDNLVVVPVIPLASRLARAFDYPQFRLPATSQGIVVQPLIDTLRVRSLREAVEISSSDGLLLSAVGIAAPVAALPKSLIQPGRVLDPRGWDEGTGASFVQRRQALERAIINSSGLGRESNRLLLAQFLLAHRFAAEVQGELALAAEERPALAAEPRFLLLRGASRLLDGRLREASDDLAWAESAGMDETHLWAEAARAAAGEPPRSLDDLPRLSDLALGYPAVLREPLSLLLAQAAIAGGKFTDAAALLEAAARDVKTAEGRGQIAYLDGLRKQALGDVDGAIASFEQAARTDPRRARAQAELARVMLLRREGRLASADAIAALEALRFAWRGDAAEFRVLRELGRQHIEADDTPAALRTWKQAVSAFPRLPETPEVTRDMARAFEGLYLEGGADRLPPVSGLAVFEEFKELTPPGEKGSAIIGKLADRLARADLLEQAADLLQGLLAGAPSSHERAHLGERLADIHLLDRQPAAALEALRITAAPNLARDLQRRRALLQARALAATDRGDEALAAIAADDGLDAELVRAKVFRSRSEWGRAAGALRRVVEASRGNPATALDERQARDILDLAVALTLAGSTPEVGQLDADYGRAMATTPLKDAFRLIAGSAPPPDADAKALAELVEKALAFRRSLTRPPATASSR